MFPRFFFFTDPQALRYLNTQEKLNQRHIKWVEFMQSYTFVLKHKSRKNNWVIDTLSRRVTLLGIIVVKPMELESMNIDYEVNKYFVDACKASKEPCRVNGTPYLEYFIQEGYIFKGHHLCIPKGSA